MPVVPTYPGVYVEEISSGVRTITGVATSITAFLGRALRGPVNEPVRIQSFGDFQRQYGGLWQESTLSYAVQQYFLNGGADALIVRLANTVGEAASVTLTAGPDTLTLEAVEPGNAGNNLRATVTHSGVTDANNFNLTIFEVDEGGATVAGSEEEFNDIAIAGLAAALSAADSAARVAAESLADLPSARPDTVTAASFTDGGQNAASKATISLPVPSDDPLVLEAANEGIWGNDLRALVDHNTAEAGQFNLTVQYVVDGQIVTSEIYRNLDMGTSDRRFVGDVLQLESTLVRLRVDDNTPLPGARPDPTFTTEGGPAPVNAAANTGNDGLVLNDSFYLGSEVAKTGIYALEKADLFNLLCLPPITRDIDINSATWIEALTYCHDRRALLIVDPPMGWRTKDAVLTNLSTFLSGFSEKQNALLTFPRVQIADPLKENRLADFAPCGVVAGVIARTDANRGVWKAPAGIEATLTGVRALTVKLTDGENGQLNPLGVDCLRSFPVYGNVLWGARTLAGDDRLASEWKYIPVRRLALFIEESLYRGLQWVVFEPNDEPLWAQIRLNVGAFMNNLFRQGAFQGQSPRDAYLVKCDRETNPQNDIDRGIVNVVVGFAPLKPAEFVIIKLQQLAGQVNT